MIKKSFLAIILFLSIALSLFATGPGLPTFDFSNLLSAIESLNKAVEFYEDTANKLNEYRLKIEELGRTLPNVDLNKILDAIKRGEYNLDIINSYLDELDSKIDDLETESDNFWNSINDGMNEIIGLPTKRSSSIYSTNLEDTIIDKIKNHAEEQLNKARTMVHDSANEIKYVISDYEVQMEKLNISINMLSEDIQNLFTLNASSQNAMQMLSAKSKELDTLREKRKEIESKYNSQVERLKELRNKNQKEYILLVEATTKLNRSLNNISVLNEKNEKLSKKISSYKPRKKFRF